MFYECSFVLPTSDVMQVLQLIVISSHHYLSDADPSCRICGLWLRRDKFIQTTEFCGGKGMARPLSQEESASTLALTGFYCSSGHITLRMILI